MLSVIVDGLWREGDKSLAVRLVADNGEALPPWQPGAHVDVHLPCGVVRPYSLTGACGDESYLICVGRETASRGESRYVHETLRPGQKLMISAPRNLFPLQQAERVLLTAAGWHYAAVCDGPAAEGDRNAVHAALLCQKPGKRGV